MNYFKTNTVYIRYIRFRNPVLNEGEQDFHMDWYAKCKILRLELFFIIDTMDINNGCIELIDDNIVKSILMPECSVLLMDSTILHRGSRNVSGKKRRVVSCQIASELMNNESFLKEINLK